MLTALWQPACSLLCTPRPVCWCIACAVLCRVEGLHLDCSPHSLFRALSQPLETSKVPRESCHGLVLELQELKHPPGPTTLTLSFWLSPELLFTAQLTSVHTDHTVLSCLLLEQLTLLFFGPQLSPCRPGFHSESLLQHRVLAGPHPEVLIQLVLHVAQEFSFVISSWFKLALLSSNHTLRTTFESE